MSGLMYWVYAQPDFNSVSSSEEMATVSSKGFIAFPVKKN
jgi:hypothetical protein